MSLREFLFSFRGRVSRRHYWLFVVSILPIWLLALIVDNYLDYAPFQGPCYLTAVLALIWPSLAVQVKRWHDRDQPGWWVLIMVVPFIGPVCAMAVNGFLKGTVGGNRFGPDPLGQNPNQRSERP